MAQLGRSAAGAAGFPRCHPRHMRGIRLRRTGRNGWIAFSPASEPTEAVAEQGAGANRRGRLSCCSYVFLRRSLSSVVQWFSDLVETGVDVIVGRDVVWAALIASLNFALPVLEQ